MAAERVDEVAILLDRAYGPRRWRRHHPPLDELVLTILSQHTSDTNTERAFSSLRARFPTWDAVRAGPTAEVADAIRSGGLAALKAPRIQAVLAAVHAERGAFDLDHLASLPLPEAKRWLTNLRGVGPKTAACVLLFSLGRPALPVDTHVHRVANRLGLAYGKTEAQTARALEPRIPNWARMDSHIWLIRFGRRICRAPRPRCRACFLADLCEAYRERRVMPAA